MPRICLIVPSDLPHRATSFRFITPDFVLDVAATLGLY